MPPLIARTSKIVLIACLAGLQACKDGTYDPPCTPVSATPQAQQITAALQDLKDQYKLNAIVFGAERDGVPLMRTALGVSSGEPATTQMHFRVGAVGWQYLTTVLLRLSAQNPAPIALTDPVSKWYPNYPYADRMTVRMLAASSAGMGDYITSPKFLAEVEADPLRVWSADDLIVRSVEPYQIPQFPNPGQDWDYSHTGFVMLGAILEKATGKSYDTLVRELVIDPLGLRNTRLQFDAKPQQPVLQTLADTTFLDSTYWNPSFVSWGAMTSNICDVGKFNRAFGTGSLLPAELRGEITAPLNVGKGINTPQGYFGLGTIVVPPWIVQHAAYWGMYTSVAYDPTTGTSLAVTVSLSPQSPPGKQPSREILAAMSRILTPEHPLKP